jgi:hypothetical protein
MVPLLLEQRYYSPFHNHLRQELQYRDQDYLLIILFVVVSFLIKVGSFPMVSLKQKKSNKNDTNDQDPFA